MRTDVLVLGGGLIGCLSALRLAERGLAVSVVERARPGAEASGAAAGILSPQVEAERAGPFLELALRSRGMYAALLDELRSTGVDVGYRGDGTIALAFDQAEADALTHRAAWQAAAGLTVERLSTEEVRSIEPELAAPALALRFGDDHQVEAPRLMYAVELAARSAGVRFVCAEARRVLHDGARVTGLATDGESFESAHIVVACGSWSALIEGVGLPARAVVPLRGQLLELEAGPLPIRHVVFADGGYLVPRSDGRLLVGSTEESVGFCKGVTAQGLERLSARARRVCPSLAGRMIARSWSGLRPSTPDRLPLLGSTGIAGLHVATGHHRNGVLLAPITAAIVAALVTGERPPVELGPFSPARA